MSIEELFEKTVIKAVEKIDDSSIKELSLLCKNLLEIEGRIGNTEEALKRLKKQYRELSENQIPDKLMQLGVSDIKLNDGSRISAEPFYSARISAEKLESAHKWLRENGHGDMIKNTLTLTFAQGEDEIAKELAERLFSDGHTPKQKEAVHPSSLRAFVKERIELGDGAFDVETQKNFSVYTGKRTKINR